MCITSKTITCTLVDMTYECIDMSYVHATRGEQKNAKEEREEKEKTFTVRVRCIARLTAVLMRRDLHVTRWILARPRRREYFNALLRKEREVCLFFTLATTRSKFC